MLLLSAVNFYRLAALLSLFQPASVNCVIFIVQPKGFCPGLSPAIRFLNGGWRMAELSIN